MMKKRLHIREWVKLFLLKRNPFRKWKQLIEDQDCFRGKIKVALASVMVVSLLLAGVFYGIFMERGYFADDFGKIPGCTVLLCLVAGNDLLFFLSSILILINEKTNIWKPLLKRIEFRRNLKRIKKAGEVQPLFVSKGQTSAGIPGGKLKVVFRDYTLNSGGIDEEEFARLDFADMGRYYASRHSCTGVYRDIDFRLADVNSAFVKDEPKLCYFHGLWMDFPLESDAIMGDTRDVLMVPSGYRSMTIYRGRYLFSRHRRRRVRAKNAKFNRCFRSYSFSGTRPSDVLTKEQMEKIVRFTKKYHKQVLFGIAEGRLFVLVNDGIERFRDVNGFVKTNISETVLLDGISEVTEELGINGTDTDIADELLQEYAKSEETTF